MVSITISEPNNGPYFSPPQKVKFICENFEVIGRNFVLYDVNICNQYIPEIKVPIVNSLFTCANYNGNRKLTEGTIELNKRKLLISFVGPH